MNSYEQDYFKAMKYEYPSRIPTEVSLLPATWAKYGEALEEIVIRYPTIFRGYVKGSYKHNIKPETYHEGTYRCLGMCMEQYPRCMEAIVTHHPVLTRSGKAVKGPGRRCRSSPWVYVFEIGGSARFEELMIDFAEEPPELQLLIDIVLEYNMRQLKIILENNKSKVLYFGDDLGMQDSSPISRINGGSI